MRFIGQYIQDLIARFRNDVYLEDVSSGTIASGGNLGLDSNNKIVKANEPTSHDAVTLAGTPDYITISGQEITRNAVDLAQDVTGTLAVTKGGTGAASLTSNSILTGNDTSAIQAESGLTYDSETLNIGDDDDGAASIKRLAHSDEAGGKLQIHAGNAGGTNKAGGDLELYAGASTGVAYGGDILFYSNGRGSSGSSSNTPEIYMQIDTSAKVLDLPKITSIKGGTDVDFSIYSEGKMNFYLDNDNDETAQLFKWINYNVDIAKLHESGNFEVLGNLMVGGFTGGSGIVAIDSSGLIQVANQSNITGVGTLASGNATAIVDAASATAAGKVELATTAEADTGTDTTRAVTPAGLKSHVDARYSYQYISFSFSVAMTADSWHTPSQHGIDNHTWTNTHKVGGTQVASDNPPDVDGSTTISIDYLDQPSCIAIPKACKLVGFYGNSRLHGLSPDNDARPVFGLFRAAEPSDRNNADVTATVVAFDSYDTTAAGNNMLNRFLKLNADVDVDLAAGDLIYPAFGVDKAGITGSGFGSFTVVLKTLIP